MNYFRRTSHRWRTRVLAIVTVVAFGMNYTSERSFAQDDLLEFYCGSYQGFPATMVKTPKGDLPLIVWTRTFDNFYAYSSGLTPSERCQKVSERFQSAYDQDILKYITTGTIDGLPVICATDTHGGTCRQVLITFEPGTDPGFIIDQLFTFRKFYCGIYQGTPMTFVRSSQAIIIPLIAYTSNNSSSSGWTPLRHCQEVSQNFQNAYDQGILDDQGILEYINTGTINGLPVICATDIRGGDCRQVLITFQPGTDPIPILVELINSDQNAAIRLTLDSNILVELKEQKPLREHSTPSDQNTEQKPLTEDSDNSKPLPVVCISRNKEGLCSGWLFSITDLPL